MTSNAVINKQSLLQRGHPVRAVIIQRYMFTEPKTSCVNTHCKLSAPCQTIHSLSYHMIEGTSMAGGGKEHSRL